MTAVELFVPAPCAWISANAREHWSARARKTRHWRGAAHIVARQALGVRRNPLVTPPVDIQLRIHKAPGPNRRWDPPNIGAPTGKAIIDGLVDAGLIPDDDTRHVRYVAYADGGRRDKPGVTVTITPTDQEQA